MKARQDRYNEMMASGWAHQGAVKRLDVEQMEERRNLEEETRNQWWSHQDRNAGGEE